MKTKIGVSNFATRQTKESSYSHYDGSWAELIKLTNIHFDNQEEGYKPGVILINVPSNKFYSNIVKLNKEDQLNSKFIARQDGEELYVSTHVLNKEKQPAKFVQIVLYHSSVLDEDNDRSGDYEWEIISINASLDENTPMNPITMIRNELHEKGGTQAEYSKEEYIKAIKYWSCHASVD